MYEASWGLMITGITMEVENDSNSGFLILISDTLFGSCLDLTKFDTIRHVFSMFGLSIIVF